MGVGPFPGNFFASVDKAVAIFEDLRADWMFIGAIPVAVWGRVRATTDADFAISLDLPSAEDLDRRMATAGLEKVSGPMEIPGKRLVLSKYWAPHGSGGMGIDVFYSTGYDTGRLFKEALSRRVAVTFQEKSYWSSSAEDLLIFKVLAFRARDLDDAATVMERRFKELDWKYVHRWACELRMENLLRQMVAEYMKASGLQGNLPWE
jgi:hypothetical protein